MMQEMRSERQEESKRVKGSGKHWIRDEKRERTWKNTLEETSGSKTAQTVRARQRSLEGNSLCGVEFEGHNQNRVLMQDGVSRPGSSG